MGGFYVWKENGGGLGGILQPSKQERMGDWFWYGAYGTQHGSQFNGKI